MNRKVLIIAFVLFLSSIGRLVSSQTIQSVRSVDLATIFASGVLFGVVLVGTVDWLRARQSTP